MPTLGASPSVSTPYLDAAIDTPYTPPFFDITSDEFSPYLAFTSFNNTPVLKQDLCVAGYLNNNQDSVAEFNGDPTELLIDKSKTPQMPASNSLFAPVQKEENEGLFPPLGSSQQTVDTDIKPGMDQDLKDLLDLGSPLSDQMDEGTYTKKSNSAKTAEPKLYQCPICDHVSKRRYNLSTHIKTHDKNRLKEFECPQCSKRFDRRHDRDRHLATVHRGERSFVCKDCSIHFSRRDALNRHLAQRHEDDNEFD
ncbi:hypothetical protein BCV71DRAFT_171973 [Rhizopus microsporus]|uniref:C2H2-type domain-containing protein n=1 Tax=Rhizopus microsporus TaxID=58291 RepID=A0A1X0SDP0_RHIZD|nr:hypothetical protein BCV71DRAFT_171973 [Rhizopus microsporus]